MTRKAKVFFGNADSKVDVVAPSLCVLDPSVVLNSASLEAVGRKWSARDCMFATRFVWGRRHARRIIAADTQLTGATSCTDDS